MKFTNANMGKVVIRFRHQLPSVTVPNQNNSLVSTINGMKFNQGCTECTINIDCDKSNSPMYVFFGEALTHPADNYKKETGRLLALTRAVESMVASKLFSEVDGRAVMVGYYSR